MGVLRLGLAVLNTRPVARSWARRAKNTLFYVPTAARHLALTLDDGPAPAETPPLLECLARHGARATFFCIGRRAAAHPGLCEHITAAGHELANHDWADRPSARVPASTLIRDVGETHAVLSRFGPIRWFRPGSGLINERVRVTARRFGYGLALGDVFPFDPLIRNPTFLARYLIRNVRPGSVIILHDAAGRGRRTLAALEHALPILRDEGYQIATLTELGAGWLARRAAGDTQAAADGIDGPSTPSRPGETP